MTGAGSVRVLWVIAVLGSSVSHAGELKPHVQAALCAAADIPRLTLKATIAEAQAVMLDAGVTLRIDERADGCGDDAHHGGAEVLVRVESRPPQWGAAPGTRPVASIQFIQGVPGRTITLWMASARYLMERDAPVMSVLVRLPLQLEQQWRGRMLGRALAHELGHYLLGTAAHSSSGLMRATHSVQSFVRPDRGLFQLSAAERSALMARRAPALEGGVALAR